MYKPMRFGRGGGMSAWNISFLYTAKREQWSKHYPFRMQKPDGIIWVCLTFRKRSTRVELTNKTEARVVFADAVRFVKI